MLFHTSLFLGLLAATPPDSTESPRWYTVVLQGGERMAARFVSEDEKSYVFAFQGAPLRIEKEKVKALEPLAGPESDPAGSGADVPAGGKPGAGEKDPDEGKFRDAVEALGSTRDAESRAAFSILAADLSRSRRVVHEALSHRNFRIRTLAVKLLGEKGKADEDVKAVTPLLLDEKLGVRRAAVFAVRALGPTALPELVRYLNAEPEANNRKMAVKTFQHWEDRRAIEPLVSLLGRERDSGVRNFIAVALRVLTRKDFGTDAVAWTSWMEQERQKGDLEKILPRKTKDGPEAVLEQEAEEVSDDRE
jgi:hypothetical protein